MADPIRRTLRVRCSLEHAFHVFTANIDSWWPRGHRRFERSTLHLEAAHGGRFYERSASGEEVKLGDVTLCDPPHCIGYSWYPGALEKPTSVEVRFQEDGDETVVTVVHSEGESQLGEHWPSRAVLFERGWLAVLQALSSHLSLEPRPGAD